MTDWTAGYVADIGYTYGYYPELNPQRVKLSFLAAGLVFPEVGTACELGFGQGMSIGIHAAASVTAWSGTDFNPPQAGFAQEIVNVSGANARLFDEAFAEFCARSDLPDFDYIGLHGIWSWISNENRDIIVDFLHRKLKVGGVLYISYNTLPGWAAAMPLRRLMVDHAGLSNGPIAPRIESAIRFVESLQATNPNFFAQNPTVAPRFDKLKGMSRNYLAHEYFNRDWTPFYFADVVAEVGEAKLTYVGSAHLLDHIDAINLSDEQQKLLAESPDVVRREGLRDFMVNQQFRRDVFVKGALPHTVLSSREAWLDTRFALSTARSEVPLKVNGARGEANLQPETYAPLLDGLAAGPKTLRQLLSDQKIADLGWGRLMQALAILVGAGHLQPALPTKDEAKRRERTRALNAAVCERAKGSADLAFLASPVTGGGVQVDRFQQLFLLARSEKQSDPAMYVWNILNAQGQRLVKDGKAIESSEGNVAELRTRLADFEEKRLPVLQQLGIA